MSLAESSGFIDLSLKRIFYNFKGWANFLTTQRYEYSLCDNNFQLLQSGMFCNKGSTGGTGSRPGEWSYFNKGSTCGTGSRPGERAKFNKGSTCNTGSHPGQRENLIIF